ncbi:MAG: hypothetical protein JWQ74_290 [Marmoricola sp.]|nr:hypothetical protein [Marmoricola sp.]
MSQNTDRRSTLRRRIVALASTAALALGVGGVVALAPSAQAATQPVTSSSLSWGIKASFRSYITGIAAGSITASEGATRTSSGFTWTGAGGSYDAATKVGSLDYAGKVVFRSVAHTIWHITIANPSIVLDGDSTGTLVADVSYKTGGTESNPDSQGTATDVNFGDIAVTAPTSSGSTTTYTSQAVKLTQDGATAFGGFYEAGVDLDAFTASATLGSTSTPTTPPATPPASPPANPVTALVNSLVATLTAVLGSLSGLGAR